jgi:predicted ATPase
MLKKVGIKNFKSWKDTRDIEMAPIKKVGIEKLRIKNFKSWKDTRDIEMAPITMFFGGNSSGKTSLLQFLLMLKQTGASKDYSGQVLKFNGEIDLGNFKDVVFGHDKKNAIEFEISGVNPRDTPWVFGNGLKAKLTEYRSNVVIKDLKIIYPDSHSKEKIKEQEDRIKKLFGKKFDKDLFFWRNILLSPFVSGIGHIGPLREFPKRHYQWRNNHPTEVGSQGEFAIEAIIASNLKKGKLQDGVAKALKKMGLIYDFKVESLSGKNDEYYKVLVQKNEGSSHVLLPDVGFGVSQILPILTALYHSKEGAILLLEQPEIHLHPKAQIELADVIIDAAKERKIQVIIESHSEHFLTRIQTRIADETISKEDAKLYFCKNEDGYSELEELMLTDTGNIENWPPNFFGNMLEESANRVLSYLERKKSKKKKS